MSDLKFPITETPSGDLALAESNLEIGESIVRLYIRTIQGERKYLPAFGVEVALFQPVEENVYLQESINDLKNWIPDDVIIKRKIDGSFHVSNS